jgi:hypothetical protein
MDLRVTKAIILMPIFWHHLDNLQWQFKEKIIPLINLGDRKYILQFNSIF